MTMTRLPDRSSRPTGWRRLLTESPRPASIANRPNAHWLVVATVSIGAFMGQLDASIVVLATRPLAQSFHASLGSVEWVVLAYMLVLVSTVTAVGKFADMAGRKLLYIYGFGLFTLASALCGLAPNLLALDAFRVLQAIGAAMLQANSVALITLAMPDSELGRGIGVQGAAQALGLAVGPTVGGLLLAIHGLGIASWRLIFYVNVPAGIIGIILGWYLLPRSHMRQARARFDWLGLALFFPAVSGLLLALSFGPQLGWTSPPIIAAIVVTVVLTLAFLRRESRTPNPMLDLTLFHRVPFSAGITSGLLSYLVMFGVLFITPLFLEGADHSSSTSAGLEIMVLPAALGFIAPSAGRIADRYGARLPTVAGMAATSAFLLLMAFFHGNLFVILASLAVVGAGLGAFTPANNAAIMGSAPKAQTGMASGVLNMTRGMGTAMGVAVTALVYAALAGSGAVAASGNHAAQISNGFTAALIFLAVMAAVAGFLSAMRGNTELNSDPTLTAE